MLQQKGLSSCAIVLAAGLGTRMRPLTDKLPKPLIQLRGRTLLDHVFMRLKQAGVEEAVVNVHYQADLIESHLRAQSFLKVIVSDEREKILDSGYGAKRMLPHVKDRPFLLANSDTVWQETTISNVTALLDFWNDKEMDILLLLAAEEDSIGFEGKGDFFRDDKGILKRRGDFTRAPFAYAGFAILKPELFADTPDEPFSLNLLFDRAIAAGRLYGLPLQGKWMHVGTPHALAQAEALLASSTA